MYGSETMLWKNERSKIRTVQMDNFRGFLGTGKMDRVPNTLIKELCEETKGLMGVFSGGLAMWRGWRRTRLLRESM